jgi:oxygen-independent coproporphyrinogen-3 oxidase
MNITTNPGLYIHIPFCHSKCPYCDFYSITKIEYKQIFIETLLKEIKFYSDRYRSSLDFDTIYIGGGSPSILNLNELSLILNALYSDFSLSSTPEITIEVNPGKIEKSIFRSYLTAGINRLSFGIQSFNDSELKLLGRIHSAEEAEETYFMARNAGFENISVDLIYAIPNHLWKNWQSSLERTVSLNPDHISIYGLTFEPGTPFFIKLNNKELQKVSEETEVQLFEFSHDFLCSNGFVHYEVSNFSKSEQKISRHNYKYWNHSFYLSFGPSSHSFWGKMRWANVKSIIKYIESLKNDKLPIEFHENLNKSDMQLETILLSLRTYQGLDLERFKELYQQDFLELFSGKINSLIKNNYAELKNEYFRFTQKGMLLCDEILLTFA